MVAHALDVLGAEEQVCAKRYVAGIFHHIGEQLSEQRVVERIHLLVLVPHCQSLGDVAAVIALQHPRQLAEHQFRHPAELQNDVLFTEAGILAGGVAILDDISLSIGPGTPTVLIGPNGAGKTTSLRAAIGLISLARSRHHLA
jgi:ABC-type glutathione transport system ATPase component